MDDIVLEMSLLNKVPWVPRVPKCASALVPKCSPSYRVRKFLGCPSALWVPKRLKYYLYKGIFLPANIANTNCRPFQVMINYSKFIKDRLQRRCHMTLLVFLFVTLKNYCLVYFCQERLSKSYEKYTAWKVPKYGVFSGPYFPAEILCISPGKRRTRKNSVFNHFSLSDNHKFRVSVTERSFSLDKSSLSISAKYFNSTFQKVKP